MGVSWHNDDISKPRPGWSPPVSKDYRPYREREAERRREIAAMEARYGSEQCYPIPPLMRFAC